jgi:polar amino acid transport system substrate-binding protein
MSIAVRKDAFALHQWLNTVLSFTRGNGQLDAISTKWTGQPFPKDAPVF